MALSYSREARSLISRLKPSLERSKCSFVEGRSRAHFSSHMAQAEISKGTKLDSRKFGLRRSMISLASWTVLRVLRETGFEAYLVGGCIRDLLLNRVPKDFDVITTAGLQQIKRKFQSAIIVGKRFPICMVNIKGNVVEVSSFDTAAKKSGGENIKIPRKLRDCDPSDFLRWKDSLHRDFTVNSLFFDPFVNTIYDYTNAMMDLKSLKLRTVKPAHLSFKEDQARILRGLRLAARLNLSFSEETEDALHSLSSSVAELNISRIQMEINYMLSYGAAERSILLLKRFQLLDFLLPFHAAYLSEQVHNGLSESSLMLMKLFFNMDQLISCSRPGTESLWAAILAFHLAIVRNPQHPIVALTLASLLHHRTLEESIKFARQNALATRIYTPEIVGVPDDLLDYEIVERVTLFVGQIKNSVDALIKKRCLLESMTKFPEFPCSGLILISQRVGEKVKNIFHISMKGDSSKKATERSQEIRYRVLKEGNINEIRFVLGKILTTTLLDSEKLAERPVDADGKDDLLVMKHPNKSCISEQTRNTSGRLSNIFAMDKFKRTRRARPSNHETDNAIQKAVTEDGKDDLLVIDQPNKSGVSEQTRSKSGRFSNVFAMDKYEGNKGARPSKYKKSSDNATKRAVAEDGKDDLLVTEQPNKSPISEQTCSTSGRLSNVFAMDKYERKRRARPSNYKKLSDNATQRAVAEDGKDDLLVMEQSNKLGVSEQTLNTSGRLSNLFDMDRYERKRRAGSSNYEKLSDNATKKTRLSDDNTTTSSYNHRSGPGEIKDKHVKAKRCSNRSVLSGRSK